MEFFVSEHITELRNIVQRFLDKEVAPAEVAKWDKTNSIPLDFQRRFADLGLTLVTVPEAYGGMGSDVIALVTIIEMLATRSLALSGLYIMSACYGALNIAASGSEEQKRRFLPDIAAGKLIFAYGLSEPDVGADLASVTTRVERKGDRVILNGMKRWTSGGGIADYIFVLARSGDPAARHKNLTFVLVPPSAPGVTLTQIPVMGHHGIPTNDLYLENVELPFDLVLGGEAGWNQGWRFLAGEALEAEKLEVPALALGLAQAAFQEAWDYSQQRKQFGKLICTFQALRHSLADCRTKLEACRLMVYWAASQVQSGRASIADTSMVKLFVTENAKDIVLACQQILGAYGYAEGFGMERYVRDVLALPIYGGSSATAQQHSQQHGIAPELRTAVQLHTELATQLVDTQFRPAGEHQAFLDAGRLMLLRERATGRFFFYPRVAAPGSGSRDLEWVQASGYGTIHAFTVVSQRPPNADYNVVLVDLDEGPRLMSRVEEVTQEALFIGMRVRARIDRSGEQGVLVFVPAQWMASP